MAVNILDKQITCINGNKDNIRIPSQAIVAEQKPKPVDTVIATPIVHNNTVEERQHRQNTSSISNPCALCAAEERRLACLPCGHFAVCSSCATSLRSCPICRREINAFIRVFL